ncbi:50S ribosomal protein L31 [Candidatus Uhrbacteria bacterium]|nr:50S ribosomal protein L31 [Candidatus Uhrbacteria bacterium]
MKQDIHPEYHQNAKISCACGNEVTVGATIEEISVEVCRVCHPFYTGKQKLLDAAGRLERFKKRAESKTAIASVRKGKKAKNVVRAAKRKQKEAAE